MTDQTLLSAQDREELTFLLNCYGGYEHHWPEESRAYFLDLLERSEEARHLRQQALELDYLLDHAPAEPACSHLQTRILADAPRLPINRDWSFKGIWRPLSALATATAFGLFLGTTTPAWLHEQDTSELQEAYLAFSTTDFTDNFLEGDLN
ncbi:hypothetical protein O4H49_16715 [Kiloniella laminariae]|uniref:Anti sigma-E protein RseA N-terminal domain-containing protein n=1 Tax=Kiloniella laminariae TaxID=454162 RepID=A0ABT4LR65_9PROT|nr:hypothetical protein [Kiloniella laminariae]MCZ4282432.1 hypothetical protein [Kiloniella laminariae]